MQIASSIFVFDGPIARRFVIRTTRDFAAHLELAPHRLHFFGAHFPHHAGTSARIRERIYKRLDDFAPVAIVALRSKRVLERAAERKPSDPLRGPVRGDFLAAHPPNFLGITFEERVEEPAAKLIADPLFEV